MWIFFGTLFAVFCLFLLIVTVRDSRRFVTVTYRIEDERIKKRARAVLAADLHNKSYGKNNEKLLAAIEEVKPDFVLSAGDLMTSVPELSMETAEQLVRALALKYPVYYGNGNHEYRIFHQTDVYGAMGEEFRAVLNGCDVCHLENGKAYLPSFNLCIYGLDLPRTYYRKFKKPKLTAAEMTRLLGSPEEGCFTVLLAHNPAFFEGYAGWGADLTLSGHVHGGVMRLPWLGGVISTSFTLFPKYDGGLFEKNGKRMIISRGLGSHTVPLRIFNPAELVVIELIPKNDGDGKD